MTIIVKNGGRYAPCGFLIVRRNAAGAFDMYDDANTVLLQSDWDFPGVASNLGFVPCECGATDGTVDCEHNTAGDMIAAAYDWLDDHQDIEFDDPGYFAGAEVER